MQISSVSTAFFNLDAAISWHLENHHAPHHAALFTADKRAEALATVATMPDSEARGWLRTFVDDTCLADVDVFMFDPSLSEDALAAALQVSAQATALTEYGVTTVAELRALIARGVARTLTPMEAREAAMLADIDRMFAEEAAHGTYDRFPSFDEWLRRKEKAAEPQNGR